MNDRENYFAITEKGNRRDKRFQWKLPVGVHRTIPNVNKV